MAYPKNLLNPNEIVALDLRPHWWYFGRQILTGFPLVFFVILTVLSRGGLFEGILKFVTPLLAVLWLGWLATKYFSWTRTYFVVTNKRVIFRTGIIARKGVEVPLDRIMNINFGQRVFERIIGVGNLDVQSAGEEGTTTFNFVRHPDEVQRDIYIEMEKRESGQVALQADSVGDAVAEALEEAKAVTRDDIPSQIEKLGKLLEAGHVTEEEFAAKKKELLERM